MLVSRKDMGATKAIFEYDFCGVFHFGSVGSPTKQVIGKNHTICSSLVLKISSLGSPGVILSYLELQDKYE